MTQKEHIARLNDIVLCFMIEKKEAVDHIEEICSIPGVDMVQFGPADYSMSLGWNRAEHEADIELYRAACADFKAILGGAKLPKMDTLKEEGRKLSEQKKKLYAEYRKAKADMQEVTTIKANIDYLLGYAEPGRKKEQER